MTRQLLNPSETISARWRRFTLLGVLALVALAGYFAQTVRAAGPLTPQDFNEIQQLYATYYQMYDIGDAEAWANVFTEDGSFNGTKGHKALADMITRTGTNHPLRHVQSNLLLVPTAEGVDGHVYVLQIDITTKPPSISTYSRYDDKLVKTPQGWRFLIRQRSTDTTMGQGRGGGAGAGGGGGQGRGAGQGGTAGQGGQGGAAQTPR